MKIGGMIAAWFVNDFLSFLRELGGLDIFMESINYCWRQIVSGFLLLFASVSRCVGSLRHCKVMGLKLIMLFHL